MDNFTLIQNAARRQQDGERTGFASLSRVNQSDQWAAWQSSADMPRTEMQTAQSYSEATYAPHVEPELTYDARPDEERAPVPEPPKRSFALYNEIVARHNRIFGHG